MSELDPDITLRRGDVGTLLVVASKMSRFQSAPTLKLGSGWKRGEAAQQMLLGLGGCFLNMVPTSDGVQMISPRFWGPCLFIISEATTCS